MNKDTIVPELTPSYLNEKTSQVEIQKYKMKEELQRQAEQERRYYYIRVVDVKNVNKEWVTTLEENKTTITNDHNADKKSQTQFKIQFKLAHGRSHTKVNIHRDKLELTDKSKQNVKKECHMLSYSDNEHMDVLLTHPDHKASSGFMKVLLTPFLEEPHARHRVQIKMKMINEFGKFKRNEDSKIEEAAIVYIDVFFLLQFKAQLKIVPLEAHLKNNPSLVGQLTPKVFISLNGQNKTTLKIEHGGIHPRWSQHAEKQRQMYDQMGPEVSMSVVNSLSLSQLEELENCFTFDLSSAAHMLKIEVVNFPKFGSDPEVIGEANINLGSENFFQKPSEKCFHTGPGTIKLYWWKYKENNTQLELVEVGTIDIVSVFKYDINQVVREIDSEQTPEQN